MPAHNVAALTNATVGGNQVKTVACNCNTGYSIPGVDATSSQYVGMQAALAAHVASAH